MSCPSSGPERCVETIHFRNRGSPQRARIRIQRAPDRGVKTGIFGARGQLPDIDGLGDMCAHTAVHGPANVLKKASAVMAMMGISLASGRSMARMAGSLIAIHNGHADVHEDCIVMICLRRLKALHTEPAVFRPVSAKP